MDLLASRRPRAVYTNTYVILMGSLVTHFRYTLFDVVLLLFIKIIIIMSVWSVGPYLSQASTLSSLAHIPEKFAMLCLLYFVMKAILFDVQA